MDLKSGERDLKIDRFRFICIILIMMAHTIPYGLEMQARAFDVIGLIFVSSLCTKPIVDIRHYANYLIKRI